MASIGIPPGKSPGKNAPSLCAFGKYTAALQTKASSLRHRSESAERPSDRTDSTRKLTGCSMSGMCSQIVSPATKHSRGISRENNDLEKRWKHVFKNDCAKKEYCCPSYNYQRVLTFGFLPLSKSWAHAAVCSQVQMQNKKVLLATGWRWDWKMLFFEIWAAKTDGGLSASSSPWTGTSFGGKSLCFYKLNWAHSGGKSQSLEAFNAKPVTGFRTTCPSSGKLFSFATFSAFEWCHDNSLLLWMVRVFALSYPTTL